MVTIRIRSLMWFVAGLTLALAMLWTSTVWRAEALPGPEESTIVPVNPQERVLDTRDPVDLGLPGPFASQVSQKLQITGSIPTATGTKTVVPAGATGVLLNVTGFNPSANGFISIRPGDATGAPTTSSINILTGQTVPNAVQVSLPTSGANAGQIDITYDALGVVGPTTDMFIDVVGYTTNTGLQDINTQLGDRYTKSEVDLRLPIARSASSDQVEEPADASVEFIALSVSITVPTSGTLVINGGVFIGGGGAAGRHECDLSRGLGVVDNTGTDLERTDRRTTIAANGQQDHCHTNGATVVTAGTHVINLVLKGPQATSSYDDATLDVVFYPGGTLEQARLSGDAPADSEDD